MAAQKNKGLGKGLGALFTDIEIDSEIPANSKRINRAKPDKTSSNNASDIAREEILFIDINDIRPNTSQPRKQFDEESIDELAQSINTHGVIQPIMLRQSASGYELVAGERRWRAARKAGIKSIPAIVRELSEEQNVFFALIENMQREDLNPMEEATALQQIVDNYSLTQEELSKSIGKSRPYITNSLRLLRLPEEIQGYIISGELTAGHGKAIASIRSKEAQLKLAGKIVKEGLSVREAEQLASGDANAKATKRASTRKKNKDIISIEEELTSIIGTKVTLQLKGEKGKIELNYYSRDELEGLIDLFRKLKKKR